METAAQPNDEVIVAPGTYDLGTGELLAIDAGLNLHGAPAGAKPLIVSDGDVALRAFGANATYSDLRIEHTGTFDGIWLRSGGKAKRLDVTGTGNRACELDTGAAISDSVCVGTGGSGLYSRSESTATMAVTNVTAVGQGAGSAGIVTNASTATATLHLRNVVAVGAGVDIQAFTTDPTATSSVVATSSDYATTDATYRSRDRDDHAARLRHQSRPQRRSSPTPRTATSISWPDRRRSTTARATARWTPSTSRVRRESRARPSTSAPTSSRTSRPP